MLLYKIFISLVSVVFFCLTNVQKVEPSTKWQTTIDEDFVYIKIEESDFQLTLPLQSILESSLSTIYFREQHASYHFQPKLKDRCRFDFHDFKIHEEKLEITTKSKDRKCRDSKKVILLEKENEKVKLSVQSNKNYLRINLASLNKTHFYGGGMQFSHFRLN